MDASPNALAETVRAKRLAIDNDLELLRVRLKNADPRRIDTMRWAKRALPVAAGTAALWLWRTRRRRVGSLEQLLVHGLTDLYHAEHQLLPALERMRAGVELLREDTFAWDAFRLANKAMQYQRARSTWHASSSDLRSAWAAVSPSTMGARSRTESAVTGEEYITSRETMVRT